MLRRPPLGDDYSRVRSFHPCLSRCFCCTVVHINTLTLDYLMTHDWQHMSLCSHHLSLNGWLEIQLKAWCKDHWTLKWMLWNYSEHTTFKNTKEGQASWHYKIHNLFSDHGFTAVSLRNCRFAKSSGLAYCYCYSCYFFSPCLWPHVNSRLGLLLLLLLLLHLTLFVASSALSQGCSCFCCCFCLQELVVFNHNCFQLLLFWQRCN